MELILLLYIHELHIREELLACILKSPFTIMVK